MYRTGDLVRYMPDGNIEFIARLDNQVKIRGFRIELTEIETVLNEHAAVRETVVVAREDTPGDKRLVAYIVPTEAAFTHVEPFRESLRKRLPYYMLPTAYLFLEYLPLTLNGKVDRQALPEPQYDRTILEGEYVAPRDALEKQIVGVWSEVLQLDKVGVHDNFFELGGHSLLAFQVIAVLENLSKHKLSLRSFFDEPTVSGIADGLRMMRIKNKKPKV